MMTLLGLTSGENLEIFGKGPFYQATHQHGMTKTFRQSLQVGYERILGLSESKDYDDEADFEESSFHIMEEDDDDGDVDSVRISRKECNPVGECELCTGSSLIGFTACGLNGRRQQYECPNAGKSPQF